MPVMQHADSDSGQIPVKLFTIAKTREEDHQHSVCQGVNAYVRSESPAHGSIA